MTVLLIIVLILLLVPAILGLRRGAARMLISVLSFVLVLAGAYYAQPFVGDALRRHTRIYEKTYEKTHDYVSKRATEIAMEKQKELDFPEGTGSEILDLLNADQQEKLVGLLPFPKSLKDALVEHNTAEQYRELGVERFSDYVAGFLAGQVMKIMTIVVTFVVAYLTVLILAAVTKILTLLPIIQDANRMAGGAIGLLEGLFFVWLLFTALTAWPENAIAAKLIAQVPENPITQFFYDRNLFLEVLVWVTGLLL